MRVRNVGFSIKVNGNSVDIRRLLEEMQRNSAVDIKLGSASRRIYLRRNVDGKFAAGVVLTTRDQRQFCSLANQEGRVILKVSDLGEDRPVDFNFFVVNEENGLGLFQYYFHSCSPNALGSHLGYSHRKLVKSARETYARSFTNPEKPTRLERKKLSELLGGKFEFALLLTQKSLGALLGEMKRIRALEYSFDVLDATRRPGVPVGPYVRRDTRRYTFGRIDRLGSLIDSIVKTVAEASPDQGHVEGVEEIDGREIPVTIRLSDIAEDYGEYDFDSLASGLNNLDVSIFHEHHIARQLIELCAKTHSHIFCAP